jgi:hypothetical protein
MIATTVRTIVRCLPKSLAFFRLISCAAVVLGALAAMPAPASAVVNSNVRNACMADYFEHCAGMEVGSQELRRCFHKAGPKLQSGCVQALVAAGEVSKAVVAGRSGKSKVASRSGSRAAVRTAMRGTCVSGPSRPGANASTCRGGNVASNGTRGRRQVATLR